VIVIVAACVVTFVVGWILGLVSGHSRGKLEAYEEELERDHD